MNSAHINRNSFGIVCFIIAIILFVMYAMGWSVSSFDAREELGFGLALLALGALV